MKVEGRTIGEGRKEYLEDDSGLFQQIIIDLRSKITTPGVHDNFYKLSKSGGVVVPDGFGISEGFQNWISEQKCFCHFSKRVRFISHLLSSLLSPLSSPLCLPLFFFPPRPTLIFANQPSVIFLPSLPWSKTYSALSGHQFLYLYTSALLS
jgi:hypothetical protein